MGAQTLSFHPCSSFQEGPKIFVLTMPFPDHWFSLWQERGRAEIPETYQEKYYSISEGQSTLIPNTL